MNRAMFSGVAGLKTHQTKMDVIGNNIANVNTYGYKSQRAVFSDIYYQTLTAASAGTANRGGTNPSTVGYGSSLAVVQSIMNQSSMQNTGRGLDVAITGEGFLQVMDASGNIFYTKAGILDYDSNGYLVDMNGNFVLGSTNTDGTPDSQKIKLDNVGSVDAKQPSIEQTINGVKYTITASNANKNGNVNLAIGASETLPAGQKAVATISANGAITVQLNAFEKFDSMTELNTVINNAIREGNGGKAHPAGTFTITADTNVFGKDAVKGGWTGNPAADPAKLAGTLFGGALTVDEVKLGKTGNGNPTFTINSAGGAYSIETTIGNVKYTGTVSANPAKDAIITLTSPDGDTIKLKVADAAKMNETINGSLPATSNTANYTPPNYFLGGASITEISEEFDGQGTLTFNATYNSDGSIKSVKATDANNKVYEVDGIADGGTVQLVPPAGSTYVGTITMKIPTRDEIIKNLGIVGTGTPPNAIQNTDISGAVESSKGNHTYIVVKSEAAESSFLTGAEIAGDNFGVNTGSITTNKPENIFGGLVSFTKVSTDFNATGDATSFKASYKNNNAGEPVWEISLVIGDKTYTGTVEKDTASSSILLKSPAGDYVQVTNPKFDGLVDYYKRTNSNTEPVVGVAVADGIGNGAKITATPSTPSKDLGLGSKGFTLTGGTEGGAITLDELSNISIGADGTVTVSHAEKGVVVAGKISLANFANPSGLKPEGTNYFSSSANSGDPRLCDPGSDGSGALKSSSLEMSNVDLSGEFADMITTQRGFQANSRIITVSDTMLEELINLKR